MKSEVYSDDFYDQTTDGSLAAARYILPLLREIRNFTSVIDVGCGIGTWLLAARELGVSRVRGVDGPYVPEEKMLVDSSLIHLNDLTRPIESESQYELCLCLEVAEHLPSVRSETLVADLCKLSSFIAFSAAIPFQGGDGHLNEFWPEYWARLFEQHDFLPWTGIRQAIWNQREIPWWYRQNLIIYLNRSEWASSLGDKTPDPPDSLTRIHPESYLWNVRRAHRQLPTTYAFDVETYYSLVSRTLTSPPGYGPEYPAPRPGSEGK